MSAIKYDQGKPDFSLIPPDAERKLAELYTAGALVYGADNWCEGFSWRRVYAALERHAKAWLEGQDFDTGVFTPKDPNIAPFVLGQHHMTSVAFYALMLVAYQLRGVGVDDRYKLEGSTFEEVVPGSTLSEEEKRFKAATEAFIHTHGTGTMRRGASLRGVARGDAVNALFKRNLEEEEAEARRAKDQMDVERTRLSG